MNLLILFVLLVSVFCCNGNPQIPDSSFGEKLKNIEGVSSVEEIKQESLFFKNVYHVKFTQPIDWNDLSRGTFEQDVMIGFMGTCNINEYFMTGYDCIFYNKGDELSKKYNCNFISVAHRFFGDSVPKGFSYDNAEYLDCLTVENAAKDFYSIVQKLSSVLTGKRIVKGASKGGFVVNTMSCFFPDSFDAYVSYVAPLCEDPGDPRMARAVYETIGNLGFSAEKAAAMRKAVLDFQVFCIENRAELQEIFYQTAIEHGCTFRNTLTKEILWDLSVLDFAVSYWQYGQYNVYNLTETLSMPQSTEAELKEKYQKVLEILLIISPPSGWSQECDHLSYLFQSFKEMGNYSYNLSYLREAVIAKTGKDMLAFTKEMEEDPVFFVKFVCSAQQLKNLKYDDTVYKKLIDWSKNTNSHVIMIYGGLDPWYFVRIPETDNKNIHIYCDNDNCHYSSISTLDEKDKNECYSLLDSWLL